VKPRQPGDGGRRRVVGGIVVDVLGMDRRVCGARIAGFHRREVLPGKEGGISD
jgi:hypothetical protein